MTAYAPRWTAQLADHRAGPHKLKVHWIDVEGAPHPPAPLLAAALAQVDARLPGAARDEGGAEGPGFVILHRGEAGIWLLMDWWAHGDICCQRLSRADPGGTAFAPMDDRPLLACIWEMQVIEDERRAWMAHMMRDAPDAGAYLAAPGPDGWR